MYKQDWHLTTYKDWYVIKPNPIQHELEVKGDNNIIWRVPVIELW